MLALAILTLSLVAALAAVWPLLRTGAASPDDGREGEAAALRAALRENEADRESGRVGAMEADATRAEVGRRLLALEREARRSEGQGGNGGVTVPVLAAVAAPLGAIGLYVLLGSPDRPTTTDEVATLDGPALVARAEAALAERPDDARGWLALAPAYRSLGRIGDAEAAFRRAAAGLDGVERSAALTGLADLIASREGVVTESARELAAEALAIDPANGSAAFLLALAADRAEPPDAALAVWRDLVARFAPASPPWLAAARRRIATLERAVADPVTSQRGRAIAAAPPEDRAAMIEDMVDGLAARLRDAPDDPEGWARLVRSHYVLGRTEKAEAALEGARAALSGDALARFESLIADDDVTKRASTPAGQAG